MPCYEMVSAAPHVERVDGEFIPIEKGDVLESDEDLSEKWAGKFVETHKKPTDLKKKMRTATTKRDKKSPVVNKQTPIDDEDARQPEEPEDEAAAEEEDDHAEEETDVTDKYVAAGKKGLTVTKVGKDYTVKDAAGEVVKDGLKRSEVAATIKKYRK